MSTAVKSPTRKTTPAKARATAKPAAPVTKTVAEADPVASLHAAGDRPVDFSVLKPLIIKSPTTRNQNKMAGAEDGTMVVGTQVSPKVAFTDEQIEVLKKRVLGREGEGIFSVSPGLDLVYLGVTHSKSTEWLVGTKGDDLLLMRRTKAGTIQPHTETQLHVLDTYHLGTAFDDSVFEYWETEEHFKNRLAVIEREKAADKAAALVARQLRSAEAAKARAAKAEAEAKAKAAAAKAAPAKAKTVKRVGKPRVVKMTADAPTKAAPSPASVKATMASAAEVKPRARITAKKKNDVHKIVKIAK